MHTTHDIKNLLDIQDPNITFSDACVEIKQDRGKVCKFISATLTYIPTHCAVCGMKNEHFSVIKNGTQTSRITLPLTGGIVPSFYSKNSASFVKAGHVLSWRIRLFSIAIVLFPIKRKHALR